MKRLLLKLTVLLALISAAQIIKYVSNGGDRKFLPVEIKAYREVLAKNPDIVLLSDSVNTSWAPADQSKAPISDMLAALLPDRRLGSVDHAAYHPRLYLSFLKNMIARGTRPLVVVHVNMRSFSTGWHSNPGWQFAKLRVLLDNDHFLFRAFFKPLAIFKAFSLDPISKTAFDQMPVKDGDVAIGQIKDFEAPMYAGGSDEAIKNKLIYNYMYALTPDHSFVASLKEMARVAKEKNTPILFYITPVDVATGEKYLGPHFRQRLKDNIDVIRSALAAHQTALIDLSESVPSADFDWLKDRTPNEHLNERGRRFVAAQIAAKIAIENKGEIATLKP